VASWQERDPITSFAHVLAERGIMDAEGPARIDTEVARTVQAAVDFADASPDPDPAALYHSIYGDAAPEQFARMAPGGPFGEILPTK